MENDQTSTNNISKILYTVPETNPETKANRNDIRSLAQNLEDTKRHPVLIFGGANSGKTHLIISLIRALQESSEASVSLGEPALDRAHPDCKTLHITAKNLYETAPYIIERRDTRIPATQGKPFFIPIDITPKNGKLSPVKLALLDSRGEDIDAHPDIDESGIQQKDKDFFRELDHHIMDVFENYSYGFTAIYVAPYSVRGTDDRDTLEANFGLINIMERYQEVRNLRKNDFHLFLLTKWDQCYPPLKNEEQFVRPSPTNIDEILIDRYKQSWRSFQSLPLQGIARHRRAFMQYSSGYFSDGFLARAPKRFEESFRRYPRIILNWLYGNATQASFRDETDELTIRKSLFDDLTFPDESKPTIIDILASVLTSR